MWRKAKSSRDPVKWAQYKSFSNKVKDGLNKAHRNYVAKLTASLPSKPKKFWSFVKSHTGNLVFLVVLNMVANLLLHQRRKLMSSINSFIVFSVKDLEIWILKSLHLSRRAWLMT